MGLSAPSPQVYLLDVEGTVAPISLVSETWRQDDQVTVKDESGAERALQGSWYSGWPQMVRWTLRPGESAELATRLAT